MELEILFHDKHYIAVNKPAGMFVHRTKLDNDKVVVLQTLRDQINQKIFPVHRLDKPTSGILIFALSSEAASKLCKVFQSGHIVKKYHTVVRGYLDGVGTIDYSLKNKDTGKIQEALTHYKVLQQIELPFPIGGFSTTRLSLVELNLETGRMHQIRRHMKHLFHPVIGDTTYGDSRYNRLFREKFEINRLLLASIELNFLHPYFECPIKIYKSSESITKYLFND